MASIQFKDFSLNQTTITGKRKPEVLVDSVGLRSKIDKATKKPIPDEYEGTKVDIIAAHGKAQTVKLPMECKDTIDKIAEALRQEKIVKVNFGVPTSTLRGHCYSMIRDGLLIQGVSCTAEELNIVSIEDAEDDDDYIDIDQ